MRILWLKTELLHPVDKGGRIRTYHMLKELKRAGHRITYLTLDDGAADADARRRADEYSDELVCVPHRTRPKFSAGFYAELAQNLVSPLPYFMKKYESAGMREQVGRLAVPERCDVVVCDFLVPSINMPPGVGVATVLFQHNVEAAIWRRHFEVQTNPVKRFYLRDQWRKTFAYEREACRRFDLTIAVSAEDAAQMRRDYDLARVADVPTGVDTDYFKPQSTEPSEPASLVFTGSMDWLPNEDAIRFFTGEVMPRIRERVPEVKLTVVGRNPYPSLLELAARDPSVVVTGRVEDVRPYMERAACYIVPIRVGGGTRLKIYEAMAMEKPVVSTTVGAEGLPVRDGEELLIADTPEAFAERVVELLTDERRARELGERAAATVRARYGWRGVAREFAELCEQAARSNSRVARTADARVAGALA